jgi:hypothetical protein
MHPGTRARSNSEALVMQFEKAVQALCDGGVDFVVIGGLSATFHGSARVTYDLDICYSRVSVNLHRLAQAFSAIGGGS